MHAGRSRNDQIALDLRLFCRFAASHLVQAVAGVVEGLVARICVGLSTAAASLDDDAAARFVKLIDGVHGAIALLDDVEDRLAWRASIVK